METQTPPEDFQELSVIPTREDIIIHQKVFLRANKIDGRYDNKQHYLDVQFRLLREDFIRPLRNGIQELLVMGKHRNSRDDRLQDVRVYENVKILNPVFTSNGVAYKVRFDVSRFRGVQWEDSKRLIFGSLLCLSKDHFESFAFATVANRELRDIVKGEIEVRFVSPASEARPRTGDLCQMVESLAFFEAYRPVLEGLQMTSYGEFPLQRYIVECERDILPPAYLTKPDGEQVKFDFSPIMPRDYRWRPVSRSRHFGVGKPASSVTVLNPASWPTAKDLGLDDSQFDALQLALTKEFAVIQGPPGTGKTYIGLKIAKILLHNAEVWREISGKSPILVVCYTNHALDQFLEEIHAFHKHGIVRVGGRSQSKTMQECSLSKWKRKMRSLVLEDLREVQKEIEQEMKDLFAKISFDSGLLENCTSTVMDVDELVKVATSMTSQHYDSLKLAMGKSESTSMLSCWLGLPAEPADPYQDGFAKPLVMFPFNADYRDQEYFSHQQLAVISLNVSLAAGADGTPVGSLELSGNFDSFIEITNFIGGYADAGRSITILAFIYPLGAGGPIITYERCGFGLQIWQEPAGLNTGMGTLTAWFIRRDLVVAFPIRKAVLKINAWNFIGASYDYSSGMARLWHNGNEVEAIFIGKGFDLATQFPIRIGALPTPWQECYFTGRICHLHIYSEALTVENIRAVGCILEQGEYELSKRNEQLNEQLTVDVDEQLDKSIAHNEHEDDYDDGDDNDNLDSDDDDEAMKKESQGNSFGVEKKPDVRYEAFVIQDQRILDIEDDIIRFDDRPPENEARADNYDMTRKTKGTEGGIRGGGWQFQNPNRVKRRIKQRIRRELDSQDIMSEEEAFKVEDVWNLPEKHRWRLYRRWMCDARESWYKNMSDLQKKV